MGTALKTFLLIPETPHVAGICAQVDAAAYHSGILKT